MAENASASKLLLKRIAAIVLGVIVANVVIFATEIIDTTLHPMPAGANPHSAEAMRSWMQGLPASAFALVLFGWTFGAFVGAVVTGRIDPTNWRRNSFVVGALLLGGTILNMRSLPHPTWMWAGAILSIVPAAYIGGRIGARR